MSDSESQLENLLSVIEALRSLPGQFWKKSNIDDGNFVSASVYDVLPSVESIIVAYDNKEKLRLGLQAQKSVVTPPVVTPWRDLVFRFFRLRQSQKNDISKKLGLYNVEDFKKPDLDRYKDFLLRIKKQNLVKQLETEIICEENKAND